MQHARREDMAAFGVGAKLRFVDGDKGNVLADRHRFRCAKEIAGAGRQDLFFAGEQRDLTLALQRHDAIVDLAREQPQRKADHAACMAAHAGNCEVGLARVRRAENGSQGGAAGSAHSWHLPPKVRLACIRALLNTAAPAVTRSTCCHVGTRLARVRVVCGTVRPVKPLASSQAFFLTAPISLTLTLIDDSFRTQQAGRDQVADFGSQLRCLGADVAAAQWRGGKRVSTGDARLRWRRLFFCSARRTRQCASAVPNVSAGGS